MEEKKNTCWEKMIGVEYLGRSNPPEERVAPSQALTFQNAACLRPNPDSLWVVWKNEPSILNKPSFHIPHSSALSGSREQYPMPSSLYDDPRVWTPNLNNLFLERQAYQSSGSEWDTYKHMNARQLHSQFLNAGVLRRRDKWARPVPLDAVVHMQAQQQPMRQNQDLLVKQVKEKMALERQKAEQMYEQYHDQCI